MQTTTTVLVLGLAGLAAAALPPHATPKATDLFRAKRLAEQVQKRLELPRAPARGWQHGGSGWESPDEKREAAPPPVHIHVKPTRGK